MLGKKIAYRICEKMSPDEKSDIIKHMYRNMSYDERCDMWQYIAGLMMLWRKQCNHCTYCVSCNDEFDSRDHNAISCQHCLSLIHAKSSCYIYISGAKNVHRNANGTIGWDTEKIYICQNECLPEYISCDEYDSDISSICFKCQSRICGHYEHHPKLYYRGCVYCKNCLVVKIKK